MSAQARRERAYRHYVEKQTRQRQKQMARAQKAANRDMKRKMKLVQPSEPHMTTSIEDVSPTSNYPSVFDPVGPSQPAASSEDTVVEPVTVSGSQPVVAQEPNQPSRP